MSTLFAILAWMVFGLIAGAIARLLVPGRQSLGLVTTMILGIIGSVVGGGLTWLVTGSPMQPAGWILSILGAVVVLIFAIKIQTPRTTS